MMEIVGLNEENVKKISKIKKEDEWVRDFRLNDLLTKVILHLDQRLI